MFFNAFKNLTSNQRRMWGVGAAVIGVGGFIKFGYFYLSRDVVVANLKKNDFEAREYLKESRKFSEWAANDREKRLTPLTKEQKEQMHNYLLMMAEREKDIYPYETTSMRKRMNDRN